MSENPSGHAGVIAIKAARDDLAWSPKVALIDAGGAAKTIHLNTPAPIGGAAALVESASGRRRRETAGRRKTDGRPQVRS